MARSIKLNGTSEGVEMIVDDNVTTVFSREKAIDALGFYKALDYHARDIYELEKGICGPIPKGSFESLEGLVKEIVDGINGLAAEGASTSDGQTIPGSIYNGDEEDIPF
ncbi:hypothetical protein H6A16_09705 [Collinsella tanakaei]|uniref:hypothetical protein n=1 Tax=Collinsella tanakaei TaxID=626935 RepID=UPI00195A68C8|nr:hypothetical protein [Collinsella tanakaei]MBM6779762.1 hypothetical protein [Collinsella tanakaei]